MSGSPPRGRAAPLAAALAVLAVAGLPGCPPPDYVPVDAQIDLAVDPADDPFPSLGSVRVCAADADGRGDFWIYPRDPGSYLVTDLPDGPLAVTVLGFDLSPDEIRDGGVPAVLAHGQVDGLALADGGAPLFVEAPFARCGDDCPADCAAPQTLPRGSATVGLRRVEAAAR